MFATVVILLTLCALATFWLSSKKRRLAHFPKPPGAFLLGHVGMLAPKNIMHSLRYLHDTHGKVLRLGLGPLDFLSVADAGWIEVLLNNTRVVDKSVYAVFAKRFLGQSLIVQGGDVYHGIRKVYESCYRVQVVKHFVGLFDRESRVLVEKLEEVDGALDLFPYMQRFALDVATEILPALDNFQEECGDTVRLNFGPIQVLVTADPKFAEALLLSSTSSDKSDVYHLSRRWLGTSMAVSKGRRWSKLRRNFEPIFHLQVLKNLIDTFASTAEVFVRKLERTGGAPIDLRSAVSSLLLDTICETIMGYQLNSQEQDDNEYRKNLQMIMACISSRVLAPLRQFDFLYSFTKEYKEEVKACNMARAFSERLIANRRKFLEEQEKDSKYKLTLIDLLIEMNVDGEKLSDEEINDEVNTFIVAGHDTTTVALTHFFYMLSKHPQVQEKIVDELRTIFEDDTKRAITYENLAKMKYLEMVFKETMRMATPLVAIFRTVLKDIHLGDKVVPKGTQVILSLRGIHRNPKIYPEPEKFNPDRFATPQTEKCSYVAFSLGQRSCIGQRFAMMQLKMVGAEVLRRFQLLPVEGHQIEHIYDIVISTKNDIPVKFIPRVF